MIETIMNKYGFNQVAYYVENLEEACKKHNELFGSGPFWTNPPATFKDVHYRDQVIDMTLATATGQFNNMQIEFIECTSEPNPFAELGRYGFHHFSNWVDDVDATIKHFADHGIEPLYWFEMGTFKVAFFDLMEEYGYCLECHSPQQVGWDKIKKASDEWDGEVLVRPRSEL